MLGAVSSKVWPVSNFAQQLPRTQTSLFWWKCARNGGREGDNGLHLPSVPFPWLLAIHHQSLVSRSPLPCKKRSAWGGGWTNSMQQQACFNGVFLSDNTKLIWFKHCSLSLSAEWQYEVQDKIRQKQWSFSNRTLSPVRFRDFFPNFRAWDIHGGLCRIWFSGSNGGLSVNLARVTACTC